MIQMTKKQRTIEERFIEVRIFRVFLMVMSLCAISGAASGYMFYARGLKTMQIENAQLAYNLLQSEKKYSVLDLAKPLDPQIACPAWFAGTDLKLARKRLCEGK